MKNLVIVGLPVYNGQKSIERALRSLAQQSHRNIQIIVLDNCSTDNTAAIVKKMQALFPNIIYQKNTMNIGMVANFNLSLSSASKLNPDYFLWASHDDYFDTRFIEMALTEFNKDPDLVLVAGQAIRMKDDIDIGTDTGGSLLEDSVINRFFKLRKLNCQDGYVGILFYGLIKFNILSKIAPMQNMIAADHMLLYELLQYGKFKTIDTILFYKSGGGASQSIKSLKRNLEINTFMRYNCPYLFAEFYTYKLVIHYINTQSLSKLICILYSFFCYIRYHLIRNNMRIILWHLSRVKHFILRT